MPKVALCPGARLMGRAAVTVKLELDDDALVMVALVVELFVSVSESVALAPATTVPKFRVLFPSVRFC
jgi:hypothetical protein